MIPNSPEYLIEEVLNRYGVNVPMETVLTYLDSDQYLTPETLYDYVSRYECEQNIPTATILRGYKFVDFEKDEIPRFPGVYIWILKDNAELPSIEDNSPQFSLVEIDGHKYRVLYVGQAKKKSLRDRIREHLGGNPKPSTLCWSIAAIMGVPYTITDKGKPELKDKNNRQQIGGWLRENCHILYKVIKKTDDIDDEEIKQIKTFTPPVNLNHNPNKNDPFIKSVIKYRSVEGGYKKPKSLPFSFTKILSYILIAVGVLAILYFALKLHMAQ